MNCNLSFFQVVTKIASLYAERLMSDLILVVGKQELPAHRLILCASSEVFQVLVFVPLFVFVFLSIFVLLFKFVLEIGLPLY